jgi:hypothetical protein
VPASQRSLLCSALLACGCALALLGARASGASALSPGGGHAAAARSRPTAPPRQLTGAATQTTAYLHASFQPSRLGGRSTLQFEFSFSAPPGEVPPPLVEMQLRYPRHINFYIAGLGLEECPQATLEAHGPRACPRNSVMGYGVVRTGIVLGGTPVLESSPITILRAPEREGDLALFFYAEGTHPVEADVLFSGLLLSANEPFGGKVQIGVPLVETLPGAPYVSVLHLHATIGPEHLTYFHNVDGVSLAFKPKGILLPRTCPPHAFPFAASFAFSNETRAVAHTTVQCPRGHGASGPR